jgi:hypothetical protein
MMDALTEVNRLTTSMPDTDKSMLTKASKYLQMPK